MTAKVVMFLHFYFICDQFETVFHVAPLHVSGEKVLKKLQNLQLKLQVSLNLSSALTELK